MALIRSTIARRRVVVEALGGADQPGDDPHDELVEHDAEVAGIGAAARRRSAAPRRAGRGRPSARRRRGRAPPARPSTRTAGRSASGRSASRARSTAAAASARRDDCVTCSVRRDVAAASTRRAVAGQLDDADRQLGLPRQPPRLAERAARAPALLQRAPRHAEGDQPVQQVRAAQPVRRAQVELDGLRRRLGLEAGGALRRRRGHGPAAPAAPPAAPRRWRRRPRARRRRAAARRAPSRRRRGPRPARRVAADAGPPASRPAAMPAIRWSGDAGMPRRRSEWAASTKKRDTPSGPGWSNTWAYQPGLATPAP